MGYVAPEVVDTSSPAALHFRKTKVCEARFGESSRSQADAGVRLLKHQELIVLRLSTILPRLLRAGSPPRV